MKTIEPQKKKKCNWLLRGIRQITCSTAIQRRKNSLTMLEAIVLGLEDRNVKEESMGAGIWVDQQSQEKGSRHLYKDGL